MFHFISLFVLSCLVGVISSKEQYGYGPLVFPAPFMQMDPYFYQNVFSNLQKCVDKKCDVLSKTYGADAIASLSIIGDYTACATSCVAAEMLNVISYYKTLFGKMYDIGVAKLTTTRNYIAGAGDFDILGNRTRVRDSCCLPDDYFVDWDRIMIATTLFAEDTTSADPKTYAVSVKTYLDYCTSSDANKKIFGYFRIACNVDWVLYLTYLQQDVGQRVLHPKYQSVIVDGACNSKYRPDLKLMPNPRASYPNIDICVATKVEVKGNTDNDFSEPIHTYFVKDSLITAANGGDCSPQVVHTNYRIIRQKLVAGTAEYFYAVSNLVSGSPCNLVNSGFADGGLNPISPPSAAATQCLASYGSSTVYYGETSQYSLPSRYEYCNIREYAKFLTDQLFNYYQCDLSGGATPSNSDIDLFNLNLACLYRYASLKCDCMQAVVNCYDGEHEFKTDLGKTVGRATSILCGFILCQKREVFSLFGEESGVAHSVIMKQVLLQAGALVSHDSIPLATIAFVSFGLGLVAFIAIKQVIKVVKPKLLDMEEGYRNLI